MAVAGQIVTVRCPADANEPETWLRGRVNETLARKTRSGYRVYVVAPIQFKWAASDPWGVYDGVPSVLAYETSGTAVLTWLDTWPRRAAGWP